LPVNENSINRKVGIVVLNYKNYEDTIDCLRALGKITYPNTETIVVDNNSQNDSLEYIHQYLLGRRVDHVIIEESSIAASAHISEKTILVQSHSNHGYAAGNNLGIRVALARDVDYVLILNNDTLVEAGFLEPLVEYADTHENVGAVGPKVLNTQGHLDPTCVRRRPTLLTYLFNMSPGGKLFPNNRWIRRHYYQGEYCFDQPREIDVLSGCCILLKSNVFQRVGLLDENTFLFLEEFILHERLRYAGLSSAVIPASVIVHKQQRSTAKEPPEFVRNAGLASRRYYLTHYRKFSRLAVGAIMLSTCSPKAFLRRLKAPCKSRSAAGPT
jgi:GT2 family glycosyltransferase